jgi:hypothetical protein
VGCAGCAKKVGVCGMFCWNWRIASSVAGIASAVFWRRFPGILQRKRSTKPFRRNVSLKHWHGISCSRLDKREGIGSATVERCMDEHFFSRDQGLRHHLVRPEKPLGLRCRARAQ